MVRNKKGGVNVSDFSCMCVDSCAVNVRPSVCLYA